MNHSLCWCLAEQWITIFRTNRFGLIRCMRCGVYRIDPPPLTTNEASANFYTDYYARPLVSDATPRCEFSRRSRFWHVAAQVPNLQRPQRAVLDFGCGDGQLCAELRAAGWERVVGVDVAQTRIARARQTYPDLEFYDQPLMQSVLSGSAFDLIVMDNVIEHLPDPLGLIAGLKRYLK